MSRRISAIALFLITIASQAIVVLAIAAAWQPDFYGKRLQISHDALAAYGAVFEAKLADLRKSTHEQDGPWSIELSDEQINGWLAVELPRRYPRSLPNYLSEPRVAIESNRCQIACQYIDGGTRAVLTMSVDVDASDNPNELRFKVLSAKIGSVPGMEHQAVGPIANAAYRGGFRLRWLNRDEQPEAIVRLPAKWLDKNRQVEIDTVELQDGQLLVAGKSSARKMPRRQQRRVARRSVRRN